MGGWACLDTITGEITPRPSCNIDTSNHWLPTPIPATKALDGAGAAQNSKAQRTESEAAGSHPDNSSSATRGTWQSMLSGGQRHHTGGLTGAGLAGNTLSASFFFSSRLAGGCGRMMMVETAEYATGFPSQSHDTTAMQVAALSCRGRFTAKSSRRSTLQARATDHVRLVAQAARQHWRHSQASSPPTRP
jgi:hypothetical protein